MPPGAADSRGLSREGRRKRRTREREGLKRLRALVGEFRAQQGAENTTEEPVRNLSQAADFLAAYESNAQSQASLEFSRLEAEDALPAWGDADRTTARREGGVAQGAVPEVRIGTTSTIATSGSETLSDADSEKK